MPPPVALRILVVGSCLFGAAACSESKGASDEAPADVWTTLVEAEWSLPQGEEGYTCARLTTTEDVWIRALRPIAPPGTHHTLFTLGDATGQPDEVFGCSAATIGPNMVFGSGVGTDALEFPDGVAIKLAAGTELLLNLHLFNVTRAPITGRSGVEVLRVDPADVVHEAEIVLAGKLRDLEVTPGKSTQSGSCAMSHDVTVFAVFPHMHQLGSHMRATAEPATRSATVLVDAPYDFEDQRYYPVEPHVSLAAGDRVTVDCEYQNPSAETIGFGDSSLEEMCFVGLYRYPKASDAAGFICSESGTFGRPTLNGPPCADTGAPGNAEGVGRHCTTGGGECGSGASLCLAEVTGGTWGNFCTTPCSDDTECGDGASCQGTSTKVCIPGHCELPTLDAGS